MPRPAYRFSATSLVVVLMLGTIWFVASQRPPTPRTVPTPEPPITLPVKAQVDPTDAEPPLPEDVLDQVEADETETLGAEEAARRRALRERLLEARIEGE